jgi:glycosyltransferase involved in cell wall biosynthesis
MNFLFPYMARWTSLNWSRYNQIFIRLATLGHTVHIIQPPGNDSSETGFREISVEMPANLHLHEVEVNDFIWNHTFPLNKIIKKGYYSLKSIGKAREIVRHHAIDVLFVYNLPQYPLLRGMPCLKVFDFADDYIAMLQQELGPLSNPLLLNLGRYFLNKMVKESDLTLVISQVLANSLDEQDRGRIRVLPNGVTLNRYLPGCGAALRGCYPHPIVGFVGSFEYFIDFDVILDAAALLPHCTFLLVGTGREFARVKSQKEYRGLHNVVLVGGVPHDEVHRYIDAMDVCLNIFRKIDIAHGACPIKLFEYLSMKKPVISTRLRETKNIDDGFLFYADTAQELKEMTLFILQNRASIMAYIEKGYEILKERYEWDSIVTTLLNIIERQEPLKGREPCIPINA